MQYLYSLFSFIYLFIYFLINLCTMQYFLNYFSFIYVFYYIPRAWYWKTRVKCTILVNLESILSYLGETSLLLTFLEFHEKVQFWRSTVYFTIDSGDIYSTHHDASSMDSTKMSSPCCNAWYLNCSKQIVALMLQCVISQLCHVNCRHYVAMRDISTARIKYPPMFIYKLKPILRNARMIWVLLPVLVPQCPA